MDFPETLRYTKDHEWVRIEGNIGVVGLTEHAQSELGDVVYIDIPNESATLAAHDVFGAVEAVKTVADMYAPISGKILEVNKELKDAPDKVNHDCYGDGWIVKIEMSNPAEFDSLLDAAAYRELVGH